MNHHILKKHPTKRYLGILWYYCAKCNDTYSIYADRVSGLLYSDTTNYKVNMHCSNKQPYKCTISDEEYKMRELLK